MTTDSPPDAGLTVEVGARTERLEGLLPAEVESGLDMIETRRRRLLLVGGIAIIGTATVALVLISVDGVDVPSWAGWALLAAAVLLLVDATLQERTLSRVTRTIAAQRRRGAELEATVGELRALLDIARQVNAVLLPEEIYDVVLDAAVDLLGAESGSIRLRVGDLLAVAASRGAGAPPVGAAVAVEDDPAVVVVTLGVDIVEEEPPRLALPVTIGERHVGVLEVRRSQEAAAFTARSALLGRLFAEQAAAAVSNAGRFDVERSRAEELRSDRQVRADAVADTVHDLRASLSGLLAGSALLRDRWAALSADQREETLQGMHAAGLELERRIAEVSEAASAEARAVRVREPVALASLVRDVAAATEAAGVVPDAHIELQLDAEPVVLGDADAITRVLTNLLHNALEHGSPTVRVRVQARRDEARLHVADRGPGIPAGELPALFQREQRDGAAPRGRGLPIVDALVRAMGGRVGVRTQEGVGTVITVVLPRARDGADEGVAAGT